VISTRLHPWKTNGVREKIQSSPQIFLMPSVTKLAEIAIVSARNRQEGGR
jgi:hypothetical protein